MPGRMLVTTPKAAAAAATQAQRTRFVRSRTIEKVPPRHGEKPYEQLVADAFDGPVLRLSERMKLLEEADNRKIRRGDALDLINATRRALGRKHAVSIPGRFEVFFKQYAAFVACYVAFALMWCSVMSLSSGGGGGVSGPVQARAGANATMTAAASVAESQVNAARVDPPFDQ